MPFACAAVLIFAISAWGQIARLAPSQYSIDRWGIREQLPEERLYAITQTPDGYLWLGTSNGLFRYDGHSVEQFQPPAVMGVEARIIRSIGRGGPGQLLTWAVTGEVLAYNGESWRKIGIVPHWGGYVNRGGFFSSAGNRTLLLAPSGAYRITPRGLEPWELPLESVTVLLHRRNETWLGTLDGRVGVLDAKGRLTQVYQLPQRVPVRALTEWRNAIWIGGPGLFRASSGKEPQLVQAGNVNAILGKGDELWVGTAGGLRLLRDDRWTAFDTQVGLPADQLETMFEDREGAIWFSYRRVGLYRIREPQFRTWGEPEGIAGYIRSSLRNIDGSLWLATDSGVYCIRNGSVTRVSARDRVHRVLADRSGRVWMLHSQGVDTVEPHALKALAVPGLLRLDTARLTPSGRLIGLHGNQLCEVIMSVKPECRRIPAAGLPAGSANSMLLEAPGGAILVSIRRYGLFRVRNGQAEQILPQNLVPFHYSAYLGANGDIWTGSDGHGLARIRDGKVTNFYKGPRHHTSFVYQVHADVFGYLWLGLREGIVKMRLSDLNTFLDSPDAPEPVLRRFRVSDGLRSANFGIGQHLTRQDDPIVGMTSLNGLVEFDPRTFRISTQPVPVNFRRLIVDHGTLSTRDGHVEIPAGTSKVTIRFDAPALLQPDNVQFRYKLEGFDADWVKPTSARHATYTKLAPGNYTFRLTACNGDGFWNPMPVSLQIAQLPQFYETWWFHLLAGIAAAASFFQITVWRTRYLTRRNQELEARVQQRTAELERARTAAEAAAHAKSDFLATMSHEIRTPMHGVMGMLDLLSSTSLNGIQREHVETIRSSGGALLTLLNDILDLSKLEAGKVELRVAPFELRRLLEHVSRPLEATARQKGVSLRLTVTEDSPRFVLGDEARLRQVLFNVIGNAVKFTDSGSVEITTQATKGALAEIQVRDTGIGIAPEQLPDLFQKFHQVDGSYSRRHAGTGLGLAICRRLCELMQGSVAVESELGRGSVFHIRVSLPEVEAPAPANGGAADSVPHFQGLVLLAEDNPINRKVGVSLLQRIGFSVRIAVNGTEAVEMTAAEQYDIVFMDCHMPEMDGLEATRVIRSRAGHQPLIIALTAAASTADRCQCLQSGMDDYLAKPYQLEQLARVIRDHWPPVAPTEPGGWRTPVVSGETAPAADPPAARE